MYSGKTFTQSRNHFDWVLFFSLSCCINIAQAAPGDLDTSFGGGDGIVVTSIPSDGFSRSMAVQPDGKILLGGYTGAENFLLVRYNGDGTLDTSFGDTGMVDMTISYNFDYGFSIAIQADGKILIAGSSYTNSLTSFDMSLIRFNTNGTLDTTFSSDGKLLTDISGHDDAAYALAIQSDGKLLLGGSSSNGSNDDFALVRYNNDGSLDSGFGNNGKVTTPIDSGNDFASSIALQPDGQILLAGTSYVSGDRDFAIVRYNNDGSLDTSFGNGDGIVTTDVPPTDTGYEYANTLALQPDGKILIGGSKSSSSGASFVLIRYLNSGELDTTFDSDGIVITQGGSGNAIAVQPDGKILLGGTSSGGSTVVRYNTNGSLDITFSGDGLQATFVDADSDHINALALQPNGKILIGGYGGFSYGGNFSLIRFLATDANNDGMAEPWNLTPDSFNYTDTVDAVAASTQASEIITISGLGNGVIVPVTVSNGEYAINGGSYTSSIGYAQNTDTISVRQTASTSASTATNTVITVGGLHAPNNNSVLLGATTTDIFTSTTEPGPNPFGFTDVTNTTQSTITTSSSIIITGMTHAMVISITNGEYSINGGSFTGADGMISNSDSVMVRHTSASAASTNVSTVLTVGGVSDIFTSTTAAAQVGDSGGGGVLSWRLLLILGLLLLWCRRKTTYLFPGSGYLSRTLSG